MSEIADKIRAYVNDTTVSDHYGNWGILRRDQRILIRKLCDTCDMFERAADELARKQIEDQSEVLYGGRREGGKRFAEMCAKAFENAESHPENYDDMFAGYENDLNKAVALIEWQKQEIESLTIRMNAFGLAIKSLAEERSKCFLLKENGEVVPLVKQSEWISVEERLLTIEEEERGLVGIVNGHNGKIRFTDAIIFVNYDFDEKEWWSQDYDLTNCKVEYWMPLPETPKMKGGE